MKYRELGSTGIKVSALGMGGMRFPTYRLMPMTVNTSKAIKLLHKAVDLGVNYFDTGWPYHFGQSEKVMGMAFQGGYREKVYLVTKLPLFMVNGPDDFDRFLNRQLEKLQTDYLDAYFFHGLSEGGFKKVKEYNLIEKMEQAKKDGRIRHIGFSFHDTLPVFKKIVDYYNWDVTQIQYNYLDTTIQATTEGLEYASKKGMAVVIMEPLKGGQLANPPVEARKILDSSKTHRSPVEWALQFLWNKKEVSVVLSGMGTLKMLEDNCRYADRSGIGSLSEEECSLLDGIVEIYKKEILVPCTACNYCMPCPFGVNIPENFALINAANSKPKNLIDRFFKLMFRSKYRNLIDSQEKIDKSAPHGRASLCMECGKCAPKCPQGIEIPQELKKVDEVLGKKKKIGEVFKRSSD